LGKGHQLGKPSGFEKQRGTRQQKKAFLGEGENLDQTMSFNAPSQVKILISSERSTVVLGKSPVPYLRGKKNVPVHET